MRSGHVFFGRWRMPLGVAFYLVGGSSLICGVLPMPVSWRWHAALIAIGLCLLALLVLLVYSKPGTRASALGALLAALGTSACGELAPVVRETLGTTAPGIYHLALVVEGNVLRDAQSYASRSAAAHSEDVGCPLVADPVSATQTTLRGKPEKDGEPPKTEVKTEIQTTLRCSGAVPWELER